MTYSQLIAVAARAASQNLSQNTLLSSVAVAPFMSSSAFFLRYPGPFRSNQASWASRTSTKSLPTVCMFLTIPMALVSLGCGGSSDVAQQSPASQIANHNNAKPEPAAAAAEGNQISPTDVVSQFLDRVRRGGDDSGAGSLLTAQAQSELKRIGRSVQPIGSPDASFSVTRSETVPGEPDSMLVHSVWSEPNGDGTNDDYQVVWAVQRESNQWRISGLAMELQPGQPAMIIDFENGDLMAQLLQQSETAESSAPSSSQATAPAETIAR